ncbi:MAG: hypothetical protein AAGI88_02445 [Pseudomonadota bacterium]
MESKEDHATVLAVTVDKHGIGYAIFEDPDTPIDWGTKQPRLNRRSLTERSVEALISFYEPDVLVLQQVEQIKSRKRANELIATLASLGNLKGIAVVHYDWEEVEDTFDILGGVRKKFAIAKKISEWRPELKARQPKYRQPWDTKAFAMGMFEAFALAITYYHKNT